MFNEENNRKTKKSSINLWSAPLEANFLIRRFRVSPKENQRAMSSLAIRQAERMTFAAWLLVALSIAYLLMYFLLGLPPDDPFFTLLGIFVLFGGSLCYAIIGTLMYFLKPGRPLFSRLLMDGYSLCLLAVMSLFFVAAVRNPACKTAFCPSYLYLFIFALIASPYLIDSLAVMFLGLASVITISIAGQSGTVLLLQYGLIGIIIIAGMIYLCSANYSYETKTIRLNAANEELHFLSNHDQLTGIKNRHSLHTDLAESLPRLVKEETDVCFIMFDIDSFKKYNDTFSHIDGDNCLQIVVNSVRQANLFSDDCFYRFGGDEFLVFLPGVNPKQAKRIGLGIVRAVCDAKLPAAEGAPCPYVSVSAGAYFGPVEEKKNLDDYLSEADKQLYLAKKNGQNRFFYLGESVNE